MALVKEAARIGVEPVEGRCGLCLQAAVLLTLGGGRLEGSRDYGPNPLGGFVQIVIRLLALGAAVHVGRRDAGCGPSGMLEHVLHRPGKW